MPHKIAATRSQQRQVSAVWVSALADLDVDWRARSVLQSCRIMNQFWIFGYGSLMWRPGFDYVRHEPALIQGYHRRLCVYSFVHRGTPQRPGLVLGLDVGGTCQGVAYEVRPERWTETIAYLRAREQVTSVYVERHEVVRLLSTGEPIQAVTYAVDRTHPQYAGVLAETVMLEHVRNGRGISGHCIDYVLNTVAHLRDMTIHDATLESLAIKLLDQAAIKLDCAESEKP